MKKIDMHCHILPGIDDGSANPKETLAMLRMALNQDFVGMIERHMAQSVMHP